MLSFMLCFMLAYTCVHMKSHFCTGEYTAMTYTLFTLWFLHTYTPFSSISRDRRNTQTSIHAICLSINVVFSITDTSGRDALATATQARLSTVSRLAESWDTALFCCLSSCAICSFKQIMSWMDSLSVLSHSSTCSYTYMLYKHAYTRVSNSHIHACDRL